MHGLDAPALHEFNNLLPCGLTSWVLRKGSGSKPLKKIMEPGSHRRLRAVIYTPIRQLLRQSWPWTAVSFDLPLQALRGYQFWESGGHCCLGNGLSYQRTNNRLLTDRHSSTTLSPGSRQFNWPHHITPNNNKIDWCETMISRGRRCLYILVL